MCAASPCRLPNFYAPPLHGPLAGWQLHGELCHGRGEGSTTGFIWECPLLTKLPALPAHIARGGVVSHGNASRASTSESGDDMADTPHFFCISVSADTLCSGQMDYGYRITNRAL